jgi:hypothetical protein
MALADRENRILVSADTDFGELLANAPVLAPSVILLRRADKRADSLAAVVLANLQQVTDDLAAGALLVISDTRIRARRLPMNPSDRGAARPSTGRSAEPRIPPTLGRTSAAGCGADMSFRQQDRISSTAAAMRVVTCAGAPASGSLVRHGALASGCVP